MTKPWGDVIAASLAVQVVTFSGLLLVAFSAICRHKGHAVEQLRAFFVPAFAAGALGATTVFLLIPEALLLLQAGTAEHDDHQDEHEDEHAEEEEEDAHAGHNHMLFRRFLQDAHEHEEENTSYMWMFGVAVLAGFLLPVLISVFFPSVEECPECAPLPVIQEQDEDDQEGEEEERAPTSSDISKHETLDLNCEEGVCDHSPDDQQHKKTMKQHGVRNWSLVASISVGDALHNFTDGIFLGNAFLLCGRTVAYTLVATTIYHELAQEISDLGLLTNHCGLPLWMALAFNVLAGCSTMIGALLVFSLDISEQAMGIFLAISAGVYIHIFACECMPRVQKQLKSFKKALQFLLCFAVGSVPIGLVLLDHGHCEEGHSDH